MAIISGGAGRIAVGVALAAAAAAGMANQARADLAFTVGSPVGPTGAQGLAVGDFADVGGDGAPDVARTAGNVAALALNDGTGTLWPQPGVDPGFGPLLDVAPIRGDADGRTDLVVGGLWSTGDPTVLDDNVGRVGILKGKADGTLATGAAPVTVPGSPVSIAVGDMNGDGIEDAIVAACSTCSPRFQGLPTNGVKYLQGNGDLTFDNPVSLTAGVIPVAVAIADFNVDGQPDVAYTTVSPSHTLGVILFNNGSPAATAQIGLPGASVAYDSLAAGDVDGDGRPDLVGAVAGPDSNVVVVRTTSTGMTPSLEAPVPIPVGVGLVDDTAAADVDSDGRPDIVTVSRLGLLGIVLNRSSPGEVSFVPGQFGPAPTVWSVSAADLNGDGRTDLVGGAQSGFVPYLNRSTGALIGGPSLQFDETPRGTVSPPKTVSFANLDGHAAVRLGDLIIGGFDRENFLLDRGTCQRGTVLRRGEACYAEVRFAPQSSGVPIGATVEATSDAPDSPVIVPIGGIGGALPQGPQGDTGGTGATGGPGPTGPPGTPGADGEDGQPGAPGADGQQGSPGGTGQPGPAGSNGPPGPAGSNGQQGPAGANGQQGPPGPAGPAGTIVCSPKRVKLKGKTITITCKLTLSTARAVRARLSRAGRTWRVAAGHRTRAQMSFRVQRRLPPGRYRLTVSWKQGGKRHAARGTVRIA